MKDIKSYYRGWLFRDKVNLIPKDQQWIAYFDKKFDDIDIDVDIDFKPEDIIEPIQQSIETNVQNGVDTVIEHMNLEEEFCKVHKHIEDAEKHLCCDICHAKTDIKNHIDEKIEPIMQFEEAFSNLNEQVQQIINHLNQ